MTVHWHAIQLDVDSINRWSLQIPCGMLMVKAQGAIITGITWSGDQASSASKFSHPLKQKFWDYIQNPDARIDWDLAIQGSGFQRRVWQAMLNVPAGQAVAYGDLAKQVGSSPRAVAQACRKNPYPIVIPCHRVIGKQGLGGYCGTTSGEYMTIKRWLLRLEGWEEC